MIIPAYSFIILQKANAIYLVLLGTVKVVDPTDIGIQRLAKNHAERPRLDASALKQKMSDDGGEQASNMLCLDDEVEKGTNMLFDSEEHLEGRILQAGDYFGDLTFEGISSRQVTKYYVAESACQIMILPQRVII